MLSWMRWNCSSISTTTPACSSFVSQYLKLNVQLYAPDDGRRNHSKHTERFRNNQNICILFDVIKSKIILTMHGQMNFKFSALPVSSIYVFWPCNEFNFFLQC